MVETLDQHIQYMELEVRLIKPLLKGVGMKYRIKPTELGVEDGQVYYQDIIELEPIDEPKETLYSGIGDKIFETFVGRKPELKEESLEEKLDLFDKFSEYFHEWDVMPNLETDVDDLLFKFEEIAKEHYQEHPEEIENHMYLRGYRDGGCEVSKGVSLDKVLEVVDRAHIGWSKSMYVHNLRKALEELK